MSRSREPQTTRSSARTDPDRRRLRYEVHSALGALAGVLLFVVSYTGVVSLFRGELDLWSHPSRQTREAAPGSRAIDADYVLRALEQSDRVGASVLIRFPEVAHGAFEAVTQLPGAQRIARLRFDPDAGRETPPLAHDMAGAIFRLHGYLLFPGSAGRYFVGVLGLVMLASIWTGLRVRRHLMRDVLRRPRTRRLRLFTTDVHRVLGVWVMPFHVLIALTGVYVGVRGLALMPAALGRFDGDVARTQAALGVAPEVRERPTGGERPQLDDLIAAARREVPGIEPNAILVQRLDEPTGQIVVMGQIRDAPLLPKHEAVRVVFSSADGGRLGVLNAVDSALALRVYHAMAPLHFGEYAGAATRSIYAVLGLTTALLAFSGTLVWSERRRREPAEVDDAEEASLVAGRSAHRATAATRKEDGTTSQRA